MPEATKGVNINDTLYPFTDWIMKGEKTVETRNKPTLRKFVGQRVGIVRTITAHGPLARCIGYATITEEIEYCDEETFYNDPRHKITRDMPEFAFDTVKYGYVLSDVVPCEPFKPAGQGIVTRDLF